MKIQKKAFIDKIMLGFLLMAFALIFVGSVSDGLRAKTKYNDLKKIVQTAALSASKYYVNENNNTDASETIALGIVEQTILGKEVKSSIEFAWDFESEPNNVIVSIDEYQHNFFWFKLLGLKNHTFEDISAKANLITTAPSLDEANDFLPIAVNGCTKEFTANEELNYILKAHDIYDDSDNVGFFALSAPGSGQSSFAHFKNVIRDVVQGTENHYNRFFDPVVVATVDAEDIHNDVKQISQSFNINNFIATNMSISVLDCGSTALNPIVKKLIPITMEGVYCASDCAFFFPICDFIDELNDVSGDVFTNIIWDQSSNTCNKNELFRINFKVLGQEKVILEY